MAELSRAERLQIMLTSDELQLVDDWRFSRRMPSRSSAIRELLKRGLVAEGFDLSDPKTPVNSSSSITGTTTDTTSVTG